MILNLIPIFFLLVIAIYSAYTIYVNCYRYYKEDKKQIEYLTYNGSKEHHEREGDSTCPKCGKKFIADSSFGTWDIVYDMEIGGPKGWKKCPHCRESWTYDNGTNALNAITIKKIKSEEEKVKSEVVKLRRSLVF